MPKIIFYDGDAPRDRIYLQTQPRRRYGFFRFCFDAFLTMCTGGFWLLWVFVREMRKR